MITHRLMEQMEQLLSRHTRLIWSYLGLFVWNFGTTWMADTFELGCVSVTLRYGHRKGSESKEIKVYMRQHGSLRKNGHLSLTGRKFYSLGVLSRPFITCLSMMHPARRSWSRTTPLTMGWRNDTKTSGSRLPNPFKRPRV
ncbi:hypothetical protein PM082_014125 [Marasmius tenuissimus]|nr:hypothetical protein PM082_014125 [Marasmius tenuissimus]